MVIEDIFDGGFWLRDAVAVNRAVHHDQKGVDGDVSALMSHFVCRVDVKVHRCICSAGGGGGFRAERERVRL